MHQALTVLGLLRVAVASIKMKCPSGMIPEGPVACQQNNAAIVVLKFTCFEVRGVQKLSGVRFP